MCAKNTTCKADEQAETQAEKVEGMLNEGRSISTVEGIGCGMLRLGARVYELRKRGARIVTERERVGDKLIARYRLADMPRQGNLFDERKAA
jgi:hypothetical protein